MNTRGLEMTGEREGDRARRYRQWNLALIQYFTDGVGAGERIYLSVDDDTLENIGRRFSSATAQTGAWVQEFQRSVRESIVIEGEIDLQALRGRNKQGEPRGIAFLALCVLAASRMANEEDISEKNYFNRFREILQLPSNFPARPPGMKKGEDAEEPLWKEWNLWLLEKQLQPSAHAGIGSQKYINYPISQCLLRQADKDWLQTFFVKENWQKYPSWDAQSVWSHLRRSAKILPNHLQTLVTTNPRRYEAVAEAIHEIYQQWHAKDCPKLSRLEKNYQPVESRNLFAGIYRVEDFLLEDIFYHLYPKQQRGREFSNIEIYYQDEYHSLSKDTQHPGWYLPIGYESLSSRDLQSGLTCPIQGTSELQRLILPDRDFWILVSDSDNPDSGAHASWRNPDLGTRFILLCKDREDIRKDIKRLQEERLLEFAGEPKKVNGFDWVEFHQCMVISQAWDGVFVSNPSLKDALQPSVKLSIGFSGGLRLPDQSSWLSGFLPKITVFGFSLTVKVEAIDLSNNQIVFNKDHQINQPYSLPLTEGNYLIKASGSGEYAERVIRVDSWDSLALSRLDNREFYSIHESFQMFGSIIQEIR